MTRLLSLAALVAAGLAVPAVAEETPAPPASQGANATTVTVPQPFPMVRTLGATKSCKRFMPGRRIVWRPTAPTPAQSQSQPQSH